MRLWHLVFGVFLASLILAIARDATGRIALIVFFTAIGVMVLGTSSVMMLFRTVAAIGMARSVGSYAEALAATAGVLFLGAGSMLIVLYCGIGMLTWVTSY